MRLNPQNFTGSKVYEDPQWFIDEIEKIFRVMHATQVEGAKFSSYQLKDMTCQWYYKEWVQLRGDDAKQAMQNELSSSFLDYFFSMYLRKEKAQKFVNFEQGRMRVCLEI